MERKRLGTHDGANSSSCMQIPNSECVDLFSSLLCTTCLLVVWTDDASDWITKKTLIFSELWNFERFFSVVLKLRNIWSIVLPCDLLCEYNAMDYVPGAYQVVRFLWQNWIALFLLLIKYKKNSSLIYVAAVLPMYELTKGYFKFGLFSNIDLCMYSMYVNIYIYST